MCTELIKLIIDPDIVINHIIQVTMWNFNNWEFFSPTQRYKDYSYKVRVFYNTDDQELKQRLECQSETATWGDMKFPSFPELAKHMNLNLLIDFMQFTELVYKRAGLIDPQILIRRQCRAIRNDFISSCPYSHCHWKSHLAKEDSEGICDPNQFIVEYLKKTGNSKSIKQQ